MRMIPQNQQHDDTLSPKNSKKTEQNDQSFEQQSHNNQKIPSFKLIFSSLLILLFVFYFIGDSISQTISSIFSNDNESQMGQNSNNDRNNQILNLGDEENQPDYKGQDIKINQFINTKLKTSNNKQNWESLQILRSGQIHQRVALKQREQQNRRNPFQGQYFAETYMSQQLKDKVKSTRYFDIHHFIEDDHTKNPERIINVAKNRLRQDAYFKRPLINLTKTQKQIIEITQKMYYPSYRKNNWPYYKILQKHPKYFIDIPFFFYQLSQHPDNQDYLEAEYQRYHKMYNIGNYGNQLPICVVATGRNDAKIIQKLFDSVRRQNYTNYRLIHIDDNSDDGTIQRVKHFLEQYPEFKDKATVVQMKYKRNALFNRDWGNRKYCKEGDIIIDIDADDYIMGSQVFQLVNTIYQTGNLYKGNKQQVWCAYFTYIVAGDPCCPYMILYGQMDERVLKQLKYRSEGDWRTTALRTYLYKLYNKIDSENEFVDKLMPKQGQHFVEASDVFIQTALLELSIPAHIRVIDQPVYFYTGYKYSDAPIKTKFPDTAYSVSTGQTLSPYYGLQSLKDNIKRHDEFIPIKSKLDERKTKTEEVIVEREQLKRVIRQMFDRDKKAYESKQAQ